VEEPDLREHDGDRGQCDRDGTPARDHERQQPDEVLRREDLREGEEAGDRGGKAERQTGAQLADARVEHPDGRDGERLEHEQHRGDGIGRSAREVAARDARRLDDSSVVETGPVEHEQERRAEALDLQASRGLRVEALVDAVRSVGRERRDHRRGDQHQHAERHSGTPRACAAPHVPGRQRHQHERVDLRADRQPEHRERRQLPAAEQQPERQHRQERRPGVVGVQRDRPERDGREREQRHADADARHRRSELGEHQRDEEDRRHAAEGHQRLEGRVVVVSAEGGRRQEDGERARGVLDEDVAVGQGAVEQPLRVALVDVDVAETSGSRQAAVGHGAGGEVDRGRDERSAQRRPHRATGSGAVAEGAARPAEAEGARPAAVGAAVS